MLFVEHPVIVSASLPRTAAFINVSMAGLTPVGKGDEWRYCRYRLQSGYHIYSFANYIIHISIYNINLRNDKYNFCISLVLKKVYMIYMCDLPDTTETVLPSTSSKVHRNWCSTQTVSFLSESGEHN
jgi:hypothetical protein